jgi:hypothetical protein
MKNMFAMAITAASLLAGGTSAVMAADPVEGAPAPSYEEADVRGGVKIGYLTCEIGGGVGYVLGSAREADCTFRSTVGAERTDHYSGAIRKMGVDLGFTTKSKLVWAVLAPTAGYHQGSLSGLYQGASAEATVGAGIGANVLVGGTSGSIHLQTVSVTGQIGLNVAAGGASMTLTSLN